MILFIIDYEYSAMSLTIKSPLRKDLPIQIILIFMCLRPQTYADISAIISNDNLSAEIGSIENAEKSKLIKHLYKEIDYCY